MNKISQVWKNVFGPIAPVEADVDSEYRAYVTIPKGSQMAFSAFMYHVGKVQEAVEQEICMDMHLMEDGSLRIIATNFPDKMEEEAPVEDGAPKKKGRKKAEVEESAVSAEEGE